MDGRTDDEVLSDELAKYWADPLGYVMWAFPWDSDPSIQICPLPKKYRKRFPGSRVPWSALTPLQREQNPEAEAEGGLFYGPDLWACEFLDELGERIKADKFDGMNAVPVKKFSTASGHGIGKSALVAWLIKFLLDTRPLSVGTVTANTAEQLKGKTWAEVGKWHKRSMTEHWFTYSTARGNMSLAKIGDEEEWKCTAQTCREENSEAFAGQHAPTATSFYIFDEASAVPDKIWEVREGGTTDGEPMTFDFGNPTRNSGEFHNNTIGDMAHRYSVRQIDSREVHITNKGRIQEWIDDYGEESDFVKVRVRGVFPSVGMAQFMPTEKVEEAMKREAPAEQAGAPLIIGVDVARFGEDETVIFPRVGNDCRSWPARRFRGLDNVQVAAQVKLMIKDFSNMGKKCMGLFVDAGGLGAGVVDVLKSDGYPVTGVQFGTKALLQPDLYRYRADEMWGNLRDRLNELALPQGALGKDLKYQLTSREFSFTLGGKIHLEPKKDLKLRLGSDASPDVADALALTFAQEIAWELPREHIGAPTSSVIHDYDPYKDED